MQQQWQLDNPNHIIFKKLDLSTNNPSAEAPVSFEVLNDYNQLTEEIVDPIIQYEMEIKKKKMNIEEKKYIDKNLRENPVIWYNRPTVPSSPKPSTSKAALLEQLLNCTRCKMLAKLEKAKFRLRSKFMIMNLEKNAEKLQNLRNCIADAEANLRNSGRSEEDLKKLRDAMGIDRYRVKNLPDINRRFFRAAEKALE